MQNFAARRPFVAFFLLTYAITWILWGLMILFAWDIKSLPGSILSPLAIFGPSLAGIALTAGLYGKVGLIAIIRAFCSDCQIASLAGNGNCSPLSDHPHSNLAQSSYGIAPTRQPESIRVADTVAG